MRDLIANECDTLRLRGTNAVYVTPCNGKANTWLKQTEAAAACNHGLFVLQSATSFTCNLTASFAVDNN